MEIGFKTIKQIIAQDCNFLSPTPLTCSFEDKWWKMSQIRLDAAAKEQNVYSSAKCFELSDLLMLCISWSKSIHLHHNCLGWTNSTIHKLINKFGAQHTIFENKQIQLRTSSQLIFNKGFNWEPFISWFLTIFGVNLNSGTQVQ